MCRVDFGLTPLAGDIQEMENAEEDHTMLQSYTRSGSSPASLTEVMDHPPFEEHLLQHTLWPEVEKLQVLLIIPFNHLSITHTIISYY